MEVNGLVVEETIAFDVPVPPADGAPMTQFDSIDSGSYADADGQWDCAVAADANNNNNSALVLGQLYALFLFNVPSNVQFCPSLETM